MGIMLNDAPLAEGRAWHEASDEAWAAYGVAMYDAAVTRRERDAGAETVTATP